MRVAGLLAALTLTLAGLAAPPAAAQNGTLETAYVLLGPQGPLARAVLSGTTTCPPIAINGAPQPMTVRSAGSDAFPVLVCEQLIPSGTTSAALAGRNLPLPPATLTTIAVIGDTGCRLKSSSAETAKDHEHASGAFQDCDVVAQWPFSTLAAGVAAKAPQLVIHLGDYNYRESPCPPGDDGCKGSPYGDNWPTWNADFFKPAGPLLTAAPWIATRGNHESCSRAGNGYMLFFDLAPAKDGKLATCVDLLPAFTVNVAGQSFIVMDSSNADDTCSPCKSDAYAAQFASLTPAAGSWFITHRPVSAFNNYGPINPMLQAALAQWQGKLPPEISLSIAGHVHLWEALSFADGRSPQFVVGNGGTALDKKLGPLNGKSIGGTTVSASTTIDDWGFTIFTPAQGGWTANYYTVKGDDKIACSVTPGVISCP